VILIGIAFTINVTTAIACTPYVVSEHMLGTAFGIGQCFLGLFMSLIPLTVSTTIKEDVTPEHPH